MCAYTIPAVGHYVAITLLEGQFYWVIRIIQVEQKQGLFPQSHTHLQVKELKSNQTGYQILALIHLNYMDTKSTGPINNILKNIFHFKINDYRFCINEYSHRSV